MREIGLTNAASLYNKFKAERPVPTELEQVVNLSIKSDTGGLMMTTSPRKAKLEK